ncbi:hypothetical protein RRG08_005754 [Elysia crispata]|uniref:Uncharacterized protein n=1 Tax=Elysia crispata TaxID=231223 RepID=A0AAE1CWJ6_9GAST|nr:hypothetical protein RRG08_005754 [Elysia crispata]
MRSLITKLRRSKEPYHSPRPDVKLGRQVRPDGRIGAPGLARQSMLAPALDPPHGPRLAFLACAILAGTVSLTFFPMPEYFVSLYIIQCTSPKYKIQGHFEKEKAKGSESSRDFIKWVRSKKSSCANVN